MRVTPTAGVEQDALKFMPYLVGIAANIVDQGDVDCYPELNQLCQGVMADATRSRAMFWVLLSGSAACRDQSKVDAWRGRRSGTSFQMILRLFILVNAVKSGAPDAKAHAETIDELIDGAGRTSEQWTTLSQLTVALLEVTDRGRLENWMHYSLGASVPNAALSSLPPITTTPALPGFKHLELIGISEVLREFAQAIPYGEGGYALRLDGSVVKWETRTAIVSAEQDSYEPVRFVSAQVPSLTEVASLAGGWYAGQRGTYFLALKTDGSVWAWGKDFYEETGVDTRDVDIPSRLDSLSEVTRIVTNPEGSTRLALTSNGQIWSWGRGADGFLGNGTKDAKARPTQIAGLEGVKALRVGEHGCCALTTDGSVWTWGGGSWHEREANERTLPTKIQGLPPVVHLGEDRSAIDASGTVWLWNRELEASALAGLLDPVDVVNSDYGDDADGDKRVTSHALLRDGSVWAWGSNNAGQLGDGSKQDKQTPVKLATLTDMVALVSGFGVCFALRSDGSVWAWGGAWTSNSGYSENYSPVPRSIPLPAAKDAEVFRKWGSLKVTGFGSDEFRPQPWNLLEGRTMLMVFSAAGADGTGASLAEEVRLMLTQGADPNEQDDDGDTALYYAASKGNTAIVQLLLGAGADPNVSPGRGGMTPLLYAAQASLPLTGTRLARGKTVQDYMAIVLALLRAGADPAQMYNHNLELFRHTDRGMLMIQRQHVQDYFQHDDLELVYRDPRA